MRGTEILSWLLLLEPLIKRRRARKAMEAIPEVMAFRARFREAFDTHQGFNVLPDEVHRIGKALGMD